MSAPEREEFLAGVHVGVLSAATRHCGPDPGRPGLVQLPAGRAVEVLTGRRSRKAAAIRVAGRFGLCVQDARPACRYVSVVGPVVGEGELDPVERLAMARRYLGAAGGTRCVAGNLDTGGRTWRSGCAGSTGSARTRASGKPRGNAAYGIIGCAVNAGYAPLPPREEHPKQPPPRRDRASRSRPGPITQRGVQRRYSEFPSAEPGAIAAAPANPRPGLARPFSGCMPSETVEG
jgi:hypothetical protein